jgi:hypothetical protein
MRAPRPAKPLEGANSLIPLPPTGRHRRLANCARRNAFGGSNFPSLRYAIINMAILGTAQDWENAVAKLYFNKDSGTIVVRPDWLEEPSENLIEITPEQGIALGLSDISQSLKRFVGGDGPLRGA